MPFTYDLDMGGVGRKITTSSEDAQAMFNAGLVQLFGYNHEESARLFGEAANADPKAAMAHWGLAVSLIGNYNNPGGLDEVGAHAASQKAVEALKEAGGTDEEKALVAALALRATGKDAGEKERRAYVESLRSAHKAFPNDADIAGILGEAIGNLAPWKLWTPRSDGPIKAALPETEEAVRVLEHGLKVDPKHPLLCHIYCHVMELSPTPLKALPAADALRDRVLGQGHLLHMASHIDMWCAQYKEAIAANLAAIDADDAFFKLRDGALCFYSFYALHNVQFAMWAAMFDGQSKLAMKLARRIEETVDENAVNFMLAGVIPMGKVFLEAFTAAKWHVMVRFGMWKELLAEPLPNGDVFPGQMANAHYAKGIAHGVLGNIDDAKKEQELFKLAMANPALDGRVMHNVPVVSRDSTVSQMHVAEKMLNGELLYRMGEYDQAFDELREAVRRDVALPYDEPWGWLVPTRHALGALLLEQGHFDEAEQVFNDDLEQYKENLWSLRGLVGCAKGKKKSAEEIAALQARLDKAEARCDVKHGAACHCAK